MQDSDLAFVFGYPLPLDLESRLLNRGVISAIQCLGGIWSAWGTHIPYIIFNGEPRSYLEFPNHPIGCHARSTGRLAALDSETCWSDELEGSIPGDRPDSQISFSYTREYFSMVKPYQTTFTAKKQVTYTNIRLYTHVYS